MTRKLVKLHDSARAARGERDVPREMFKRCNSRQGKIAGPRGAALTSLDRAFLLFEISSDRKTFIFSLAVSRSAVTTFAVSLKTVPNLCLAPRKLGKDARAGGLDEERRQGSS